jgi:hypothetical protein
MPATPTTAVHDLVCEFVTAQAEAETETSGGWAGYRTVFLSAEVQDLIRSRLPRGDVCDGCGSSSLKKCKISDSVCQAEISWTVCCLDGTTFSVAVPEHTRVAEMKRAIGRQREVAHFSFELFVKGEEELLDDELPASKVPLFMLQKEASDRLALEALFKSTGGAGWVRNEGWMTDADLKDWHGVTVDEEGRVTDLSLQANNLAGTLPSEIQQLSALQRLDLADNALKGSLPPELGQLGALLELYLDSNRELTGPIPAELGQLGALTALFLHCNRLTGRIPVELGQLRALTHLYLDTNELAGPIPAELGQLEALQELKLHNNQLTAPIPTAELGQLAALADLDVSNNQFSDREEQQLESHMQEHCAECEVNQSKYDE